MQKTVVQIITYPSGGGAEFLVRELGHKLMCAEFNSQVLFLSGLRAGSSEVCTLRQNETALNIPIRSLIAIFKIRQYIKGCLKKDTSVIVHTHLTWPFYFTLFSTLFLDVKLVYTEHSTTNKRRGIPFFKYIERIVYSRYSKLICISDGVQSSLKRWLGHKFDNKIVVVNNGARLYNFKDRGNLSNQIRLVSIGSLSERKGFSNAIRAVSAVRDWVAKYTIVGEGPERAKLQKLIDDENLGDKVNLVGWSEQIETYLHEADIQLVPSLWEGFGLVAVEGMSTGLPVVASNVNGLNEILPENNPAVRLVTDFENPKAWVESINDIIKSMKTDRRRISRCAREQAQKYSLEVMVEKYKEVYTTL